LDRDGSCDLEKFLKLDRKGQSVVEYILLLAVVVAIAMGVFRSRAFQDFFGKDSSFFTAIARSIEVNYRFGLNIEDPKDNPHSGFFVSPDNSRFFSGRDAYPSE
jgi:hypothetical protein